MSNPTGLCKCGCGGQTKIADRNHYRLGHVKGEPLDFLHGHATRKPPWEGELPLCACGCGEHVVLSTTTNKQRGMVRGQPNKFVLGHSSYRTPVELRGQPNPLCECGCGKRVFLPKSRVLRGHHMKINAPTSMSVDRGFETPCEIWQGSIDKNGYARFESQENGVRRAGTVLVHRQKWIEAHGMPEKGMDVHHRCEQRDCCNLDHLELRSRSEHARAHRGITPEKYAEIISALRTAQESQAGIARRFGVSKVFIWKLRKDLGIG